MENQLNVYIVTYNRSDYLASAIKSVLNQSFKEFDLFVLDNASTDNTAQVVAQFTDPRVHYIRHPKNIGGIGNINFAMDHCEKPYYVVFHDDDHMRSCMLEVELKYMKHHEDCVMVSGMCNIINTEGKMLQETKVFSDEVQTFSGTKMFSSYLEEQKNLIFPGVMYRNAFMKDNQIRMRSEVGPCADIVLYFEAEKKGGTLAVIPKVLMDYRVHAQQDSSQNFGIMLKRLFQYLWKDDYYSQLMKDNTKGQHDYFRWISWKAIIRVASGAISADIGFQEIADFSNLLEHKKTDELMTKTILTLEKVFPVLFSWVYRAIKSRGKG